MHFCQLFNWNPRSSAGTYRTSALGSRGGLFKKYFMHCACIAATQKGYNTLCAQHCWTPRNVKWCSAQAICGPMRRLNIWLCSCWLLQPFMVYAAMRMLKFPKYSRNVSTDAKDRPDLHGHPTFFGDWASIWWCMQATSSSQFNLLFATTLRTLEDNISSDCAIII